MPGHKALKKIQDAFVQYTRCENWEDAVEKYPAYITVEKLEPYKKLYFSSKKVPNKFVTYCQRVTDGTFTPDGFVDHGNYFSVFHQKCIGVLWSQAMFDLTPNMVNMNDLTTCKGFGLAILDLCGSDKVWYILSLYRIFTPYSCARFVSCKSSICV